MISFTSYLAGCAMLAAVLAALAFAGLRVRRRLIPAWTGAPARLAEIVIALSLLILTAELCGAVGLFKTGVVIPALLVVSVLLGAAGGAGARGAAGGGGSPADRGGRGAGARRPSVSEAGAAAGGDVLGRGAPPPAPHAHWLAVAAALAACAFVVALWSLDSLRNLDRGMYGFDTLWYHMPFAADYVQSGSVTGLHFTDPLYLNWFYPANSELVHGIGILVFDRDLLSPMLNLAWLGLALLAAWCIGRPYGAGPLSVIAVATLLGAHSLETGQPGDAKNDIVGIALLMSSVAILVNADRGLGEARRSASRARALSPPSAAPASLMLDRGTPIPASPPAGALIVAGMAAGLAAGTKLDLLAAVALLTVGVVVVAGQGARRAAALAFGLPMLATGAFWYLRNLFTAGNPLPWIEHLGPIALPHPARPIEGRAPLTVAHYLFDWSIYSDYFFPGLERAFGKAWPVLIGLAVAGMVIAATRGRTRTTRMLGVFTLLSVVAYLFTPLSASGPEGMPVGFFLNLRYVAPALAIGLALLPLFIEVRRGPALAGAIALFAALIVIGDKPRAIANSLHTRGAIVLAVVLVLLPFLLYMLGRRGGQARALPALVGVVVAMAAVTIGWPESRDYLRDRYTLTPYERFNLDRPYQWAGDQHGVRIGLVGTTIAFFQYGLYGTDLSNRVDYIGERTAHGGMQPFTTCEEWRRAVNERGYEYVVTSPFLNQNEQSRPIPSPERAWLRSDPGAKEVLDDASTSIFQIRRPLDPAGCARLGERARITIDSLKPPV